MSLVAGTTRPEYYTRGSETARACGQIQHRTTPAAVARRLNDYGFLVFAEGAA